MSGDRHLGAGRATGVSLPRLSLRVRQPRAAARPWTTLSLVEAQRRGNPLGSRRRLDRVCMWSGDGVLGDETRALEPREASKCQHRDRMRTTEAHRGTRFGASREAPSKPVASGNRCRRKSSIGRQALFLFSVALNGPHSVSVLKNGPATRNGQDCWLLTLTPSPDQIGAVR
jgi:hypothetical protein